MVWNFIEKCIFRMSKIFRVTWKIL